MFAWLLIIGTFYTLGAIGTLLYNLSIIEGPPTYRNVIVRNALLWPIMLPILLMIRK